MTGIARPSSPAIVDYDQALANTSGDRAVFEGLVRLFREQAPGVAAAIASAIESGDAKALAFHAHHLKGSLCLLAARALVREAQELESLGRARVWEGVPDRWRNLEEGLADLDLELRDRFPHVA